MQSSVTEPTAAGPRRSASSLSAGRPPLLSGGWVYVWMLVAALAIAALTLTLPSTPTYDPWSWLLWGRQIAHGTLDLTDNGSSWKPMPVMFTIPLSLFGSAAPNLWLLIARAGFVMTLMMSARISWRIGRGLVTGALGTMRSGSEAGSDAVERIARILPLVLAGAIPIIGIGLTHGFPGNSLFGYSEAMAVAATMVAAERAVSGHHRQAFLLGLIPALDRPETWFVWLPYGLWLAWTRRVTWRLVVGLTLLTLLIWVVPQAIGGQNGLTTALQHHTSTSAVNSSFPFLDELRRVEWSLVLTRVKLVGIAAMLASAWILWRRGALSLHWRPADDRDRALLALLLTGVFGFVWWIGIALETQLGFPGNPRYAIFGEAAEYICGAAGYAWAAAALTRWAGHRLSALRVRVGTGARLLGATALMTGVFVYGPSWVGNSLLTIDSLHTGQDYQAKIRSQIDALIQSHGGPEGILNCGTIVADNHQVTMLAWDLNVRTGRINAGSYASPQYPANVIFQVSATGSPFLTPSDEVVAAWFKRGMNYKITIADPVAFYQDCQK